MEGVGRSDLGRSSSDVSEVSEVRLVEAVVPSEVREVEVDAEVPADKGLSRVGKGVNVLCKGDGGEFCFGAR